MVIDYPYSTLKMCLETVKLILVGMDMFVHECLYKSLVYKYKDNLLNP